MERVRLLWSKSRGSIVCKAAPSVVGIDTLPTGASLLLLHVTRTATSAGPPEHPKDSRQNNCAVNRRFVTTLIGQLPAWQLGRRRDVSLPWLLRVSGPISPA